MRRPTSGRHDLIEKAAELDDELMERYLEGEEPTVEHDHPRRDPQGHDRPQVQPGLLRLGAQEHRCAASDRRASSAYLPAPHEVPEVQGTDPKDETNRS